MCGTYNQCNRNPLKMHEHLVGPFSLTIGWPVVSSGQDDEMDFRTEQLGVSNVGSSAWANNIRVGDNPTGNLELHHGTSMS